MNPLQRLAHEARLVAVALQFLTRVPVRLPGFQPQWLQDCSRHFPLVGAGVGAFGAAVLLAALQAWPPAVAVGLCMAATVWLTGGFHEDGLADACDGLGGAVDRARALLIMKDSRLGSYGALGLVLTLGLKAAALLVLAQRAPLLAAAALVLAHAWSRTGAVALLAWLDYAGDAEHAKAKPLAQHIGPGALGVALAWCALLALGVWLGVALLAGPLVPALAPLRLVQAALAAAAVAWWCGRWLRRRLGGFTGDGLGATQQWCELAVYLTLAAGSGAGQVVVAELWLWRHPRPQGAAGRCIGRTDLAVDPRRAKRLAHHIRAAARRHGLPRVVWTSPLRRCADVGRWLARWGWRHQVDTGLLELDFGRWDGQPWSAIARAEVAAWEAGFAHHAPGGGEPLQQLVARCHAFCAAQPQGPLLLVAHAGWINACAVADVASLQAGSWPPAPAYGSLRRATAA